MKRLIPIILVWLVIVISPVVSLAGESVDSYFEIPPENLPKSERELFAVALQQQKYQLLESSIDLWKRFLSNNPRSFRGYNNLGVAHFANDQLSQALTNFETGLALKPLDPKIKENLKRTLRSQVTLLRESKDYDAAIQFLKRIKELSVEPEREKVALEIETLEDLIFEQVKGANTLEYYELFLARYPNSRKNSDEARRRIARMKSADSEKDRVSIIQEEERSKRKELEDAQERVRLNPNDAIAYSNLGLSYGELGRYQDAIASWREVIRIEPDFPYAYAHLGAAYGELGRYQDAIAPLKEAIRIKPDDAVAYSNLGFSYESLGRYTEALAEYKKAIRIEPDLTSVRNNLNKLNQKIENERLAQEKRLYKKERERQEALHITEEADRLTRERKLLEEERRKLEALRLAEEKRKQQTKEPSFQSGTGSGFFISKMGHIITNAHVVKGCKKVTVGDGSNKQASAKIINTDERNDLALLKLSTLEMVSAESKSLIQKLGVAVIPLRPNGLIRSEDVKPGEPIFVAGFPYGDFISNTMKFENGQVSALLGPENNSGQFQLSAPIQPGNSGGPIYDQEGNIVGVVVSQLNKKKMMEAIGNVPENQNFGIKASVVRQFLESNGHPSKIVERTEDKLSSEEIYPIAKNQALMVMCFN